MVSQYTKTLEYSVENIKELEALGYVKSPVCKPYSKDKVLRYNPKRMVYWFSNRTAAYMSHCQLIQDGVKSIWLY